jgi:hypothetical protein
MGKIWDWISAGTKHQGQHAAQGQRGQHSKKPAKPPKKPKK